MMLAEGREQGTIRCVGVVKGQERFDANTHPHTHFVCDGCGAVIDLHEIPADTELDRQVQDRYGLKVDGHELIFHGVCKKCKPETLH